MNVIDLFSCLGSHALGLAIAGDYRTVAFCERQEQRRRFLELHYTGIPVHDDVRTFRGHRGQAELVIGGPPCQRTSVASAISGNRTGESLWPDMLRICIDVGCEWVVVEQPPGNAAWEAQVAGDLAESGFHVARAEFAACDLGAPHIRRRVFILAHPCLSRLALAWQAIPSEIEGFARATIAGNHWLEGPPRTLRVVDRPPHRLDRTASIEAIGDSNPPGMATVIGRAIMSANSCHV